MLLWMSFGLHNSHTMKFVRRTVLAEGPPNNPTNTPVAKVLFNNPSGPNIEGTEKISSPTETVSTPPMWRQQPKPATSPHAINLARQMKYNEPKFEDGHDSDGELAPHSFVVEEEGVQDYDDDELPSSPPVIQQTVLVPEVSDVALEHSGHGHVPIGEEALPPAIEKVLSS
jgi:hypothetical protein